jgi:hypothetical protein
MKMGGPVAVDLQQHEPIVMSWNDAFSLAIAIQ